MSADADVARAWVNRWDAADLSTYVPGGLVSDRLSETQGLPSQGKRPNPYARLLVAKGKDPEYVSGGEYIDYRKVTVEVYGVGKQAVGTVVSAVRGAFDRQALHFDHEPRVVSHMMTFPLGDSEEPDETEREGEDIRKAVLEWMVTTHRTGG